MVSKRATSVTKAQESKTFGGGPAAHLVLWYCLDGLPVHDVQHQGCAAAAQQAPLQMSWTPGPW